MVVGLPPGEHRDARGNKPTQSCASPHWTGSSAPRPYPPLRSSEGRHRRRQTRPGSPVYAKRGFCAGLCIPQEERSELLDLGRLLPRASAEPTADAAGQTPDCPIVAGGPWDSIQPAGGRAGSHSGAVGRGHEPCGPWQKRVSGGQKKPKEVNLTVAWHGVNRRYSRMPADSGSGRPRIDSCIRVT